MRTELAVYRGGRYVSNWPVVIVIGLIVGVVAGGGYATTRLLMGAEFRFVSIVFAVFLSIGFFAGLSIRKCYMLQPEYGSGNRRHR